MWKRMARARRWATRSKSALAQVYGQGRAADRPLWLGSVKCHFGHLEAAAGIAGLMKAVLALEHRAFPPQLHFNTPSPHIDWPNLPVRVPTALTPWPAATPRRAAVSSFGFGGTNAHVVLESPLPAPAVTTADRSAHLLALSARTEPALCALAGRFASHLTAHPAQAIADVAHTANTGRSHFAHRLAVVGVDAGEIRQQLAAAASGERPLIEMGALETSEAPEVAFLFTGQGSQYVGMGHDLFQTQPGFRRTLERCDELLRPHLDVSLLQVLFADCNGRLNQTAYSQPALFALEYALAELWRSWGVAPAWVLGHSVGEFVAACVAGVFSLEEGLGLVAQRGRLMQELPPDGGMAAVRAGEAAVAAVLTPADRADVSIAALNGAEQTVLAGRRPALERVLGRLDAQGLRASN